MFYVTVFSIYYERVVVYVEKHFITFLTERKHRRREHIVKVVTRECTLAYARLHGALLVYNVLFQCNVIANQLMWFPRRTRRIEKIDTQNMNRSRHRG